MKNFVEIFLPLSLHSFQRKTPVKREKREFSSAGSEHLPYKQRVGGSNPSTPTRSSTFSVLFLFLTNIVTNTDISFLKGNSKILKNWLS